MFTTSPLGRSVFILYLSSGQGSLVTLRRLSHNHKYSHGGLGNYKITFHNCQGTTMKHRKTWLLPCLHPDKCRNPNISIHEFLIHNTIDHFYYYTCTLLSTLIYQQWVTPMNEMIIPLNKIRVGRFPATQMKFVTKDLQRTNNIIVMVCWTPSFLTQVLTNPAPDEDHLKNREAIAADLSILSAI
jgi:hypothetical protein